MRPLTAQSKNTTTNISRGKDIIQLNGDYICMDWSIEKIGELNDIPELISFADKLERATVSTIEDGIMTGDLVKLSDPPARKTANTEEFIDEIAARLAN